MAATVWARPPAAENTCSPDRIAGLRPIGRAPLGAPPLVPHAGAMARILFGTDGVRGVVGEKVTADLARSLGRAATTLSPARAPRVLDHPRSPRIGRDARGRPGRGRRPAGGEATLGGVLPTPAAPLAILRGRYDLAAVISASHNPWQRQRDQVLRRPAATSSPTTAEAGDRARELEDAGRDRRGRPPAPRAADARDYLAELRARFAGLDLAGTRVLLDCANGATHRAAPAIFRALGAAVTVLADRPDGRNINAGVRVDAPGAAPGRDARRRLRHRLRLRR